MGRVRRRVGDKRVLALVKAFLKAGVLSEDGVSRDTHTGTPQGGILSPLLASIALSVLDEHISAAWTAFGKNPQARSYRRRKGLPTYKIVRYADDFVIMVAGSRAHAETLRDEVATVIATVGLRLSAEKTTVVHIDEGFTFLGFRIQRQIKRGSTKAFVYTWPDRKALASVTAKVRAITKQGTNKPLADLLRQINPVLRGWTNYSATACPRRHSPTCTSSLGGGYSDGCAANTATATGSSSAAATYPGGGRRTVR
jgi:RNA-directed DNA polymerase